VPEELCAAGSPAQSAASSARGPYVLRSDTLATASPSLVAQWQAFHDQHAADDPMQDPEWLRGYFHGKLPNLSFYSLLQDGQLRGLAPFMRKQWPMPLQFGAWTLAECPLMRLRLLGTGLDFPDDEAAHDLIFGELAKPDSGFDALYLEEIPVDSFLWKYLHESKLIRNSFLSYAPSPPTPRPVLRVEGTYEQYLSKFNSKHRNTIGRKIKKLREGALGEMRLVRYEAPEEVGTFLDQAVEVSRKTYQWTLHGRGLSENDLLRERMAFAAKRGWMRSYLLFCGGQARAFLLGFQYNGRFLLHELGFDPELAKYSVGTVLQMLSVEDLFTHNRPHIFDLQDYGAYKEALATESYLQGKLYLFRPRPYARFLRASHRGCEAANRAASLLLDRLNLKTKIRQRMRRWSDSQ
jgi:CelD/BcsL family acetyltransferase involved in cellulose biosynthesis